MALLDWIVIGIFGLALIGIILWVFKQKQASSGGLLSCRARCDLAGYRCVHIRFKIGSEHLIGLAGAGASSGMAMAHWEIQGWMILILAGFLFRSIPEVWFRPCLNSSKGVIIKSQGPSFL
jgi:SSS family solute:Na+ symporter